MLSRAMACWPKDIPLFETCFVPAGLQGDIAHATKLRRDSECKSRFCTELDLPSSLKPEGHRCKSCHLLSGGMTRWTAARAVRPQGSHSLGPSNGIPDGFLPKYRFAHSRGNRPPSAAKARVLHVIAITCCF